MKSMHIRGAAIALALGIFGPLAAGDRAPGGTGCLLVRPAAAFTGLSEPPAACPDARSALKTRLARIFAAQQQNGNVKFEGSDTTFYRHPIMGTLALEVYRASGDRDFLEKTHDALKRYIHYLLANHDSDRDFLVERASSSDPAWPADLEDVGFNAMLALDMLSLSRICVELGRPLEALYWYRGMRTVSSRLVRASFDLATLYFLPTRASAPRKQYVFAGLSALPLYFASEFGPEIALRVLRTHVLAEHAPWPDSPARYLSPDSPPTGSRPDPAAWALRSLLLLGALERNGLAEEASRLADGLGSEPAETAQPGQPDSDDEIARYALCMIRSGGPYALFPERQELAVLDQLVFRKALLEPERTAALRRSLSVVGAYLSENARGASGAADLAARVGDRETIGSSIRDVYFSISLLRDQLKQRALFSKNDLLEIPGFDLHAAVTDLWDDVVESLRAAETLATREEWLAEGFDLSASAERSSVGPGEPVPLSFSASSSSREVAVTTIVVHRREGADTLWSGASPLVLPAGAGREFSYAYPLRPGRDASIEPVAFSAEVQFEDGRRARYHFRTGVFVTRPVTCTVEFPKGTTLADGAVPVEILVEKHVPRGVAIQAHWYSPVGLKPAEGRSVEAWMPEETSAARMTLNVLVPTPCRPGSFPFTLTVLANGEEIATASSTLFRHYQWLFVGPFSGRRDALDTRYPPETRTDPLDTYAGALGDVVWQPLPADAYNDAGRIALGALLPEGSVGFLYTVVETAAPRVSAAIFACDAPAVLFVNGEAVARSGREGASSPQRAKVPLRGGANNILVKTISTGHPVVFFQLGDEEDLMSDDFNNNLWELVDGYAELAARRSAPEADTEHVQRQVTITYRDSKAASVAVVGSFNGWSPANSAMRKNKYGEWEINLYLSPGRYTYRLRIDAAAEVVDPSSPYSEPDGYGGQNSVLYVQ